MFSTCNTNYTKYPFPVAFNGIPFHARSNRCLFGYLSQNRYWSPKVNTFPSLWNEPWTTKRFVLQTQNDILLCVVCVCVCVCVKVIFANRNKGMKQNRNRISSAIERHFGTVHIFLIYFFVNPHPCVFHQQLIFHFYNSKLKVKSKIPVYRTLKPTPQIKSWLQRD